MDDDILRGDVVGKRCSSLVFGVQYPYGRKQKVFLDVCGVLGNFILRARFFKKFFFYVNG